MSRLTDRIYWESTYAAARGAGIVLDDWRSFTDTQIFRALTPALDESLSVIELGAGDSMWLPFLAKRYPAKRFAGLDYAEAGCSRLRARLQAAQANADVTCADLFDPPVALVGEFDLVVSFGVVEHFKRLADVLSAKARFVRPGGQLFTLIPNMAGAIGALTRRWNERVYRLHVPHDLSSFVAGHREAGLEVTAAGYLGSSNFGVLSSCFNGPTDHGYGLYKQLSRVSKLAWLVEARGLPLPATKALAPYICCTARRSV